MFALYGHLFCAAQRCPPFSPVPPSSSLQQEWRWLLCLLFSFFLVLFAGLLVVCVCLSVPPPLPSLSYTLSTHGLPCSVCVSGVGAAFVVLSAVSWGEDKHVWRRKQKPAIT